MSWLMDDVLGFDPNGGGIYGAARDVLGSTIADDWLGFDPHGGGIVGAVNTVAPMALAALGAYAYDPTMFAGLGEAGGATGEAGAAAAGTEGTTAAMSGGFGQGTIAPEVTAFAPDAVSTASNIPAATAGMDAATLGEGVASAPTVPYASGPNMMGPQTAADLGSQFQTGMTQAGVESSPTLGSMFQQGWDAVNKPLWQGGPSARAGLTGMQLGGNLYSIYAQKKMAQARQAQLDKINGMYAPGTPEYNMMMQQMARKDAAAGRNSQYGVRAQELAGQIAQKKMGMLGTSGYNDMFNSQLANQYGSLSSLFANAGAINAPKATGSV